MVTQTVFVSRRVCVPPAAPRKHEFAVLWILDARPQTTTHATRNTHTDTTQHTQHTTHNTHTHTQTNTHTHTQTTRTDTPEKQRKRKWSQPTRRLLSTESVMTTLQIKSPKPSYLQTGHSNSFVCSAFRARTQFVQTLLFTGNTMQFLRELAELTNRKQRNITHMQNAADMHQVANRHNTHWPRVCSRRRRQ